jgi:hypothetical protein
LRFSPRRSPLKRGLSPVGKNNVPVRSLFSFGPGRLASRCRTDRVGTFGSSVQADPCVNSSSSSFAEAFLALIGCSSGFSLGSLASTDEHAGSCPYSCSACYVAGNIKAFLTPLTDTPTEKVLPAEARLPEEGRTAHLWRRIRFPISRSA